MKEEILSERYAKALIALGVEGGNLDLLQRDLGRFEATLSSSEGLGPLLQMREVAKTKRCEIATQVAAHLNLHPWTGNLIQMLIERERIAIFPWIVKSFEKGLRALKNEVVVTVKMADPVTTKKNIDTLMATLKKMIGKEVRCELEEDSSLIGGIAVQIGDTVYDGSIRGELEKLQETLT